MKSVPLSGVPRRLLLGVPVLGLALSLASCGGNGTSGTGMPGMSAMASAPGASASGSMPGMATYPPVTPGPAASGPKNDTDVTFANDMIPHHGQAVQMVDMVLAKTGNSEVKALAERIKAAQTPEIATMSGWLKGWGQAVPDPYAPMAGMSGMTGMSHSGMMSDEQMAKLHGATGVAADKAFLTLMQAHHRGAIDMAKTELAQGANPEAKKVAQSISTSQTAEIAEMKKLLDTIG